LSITSATKNFDAGKKPRQIVFNFYVISVDNSAYFNVRLRRSKEQFDESDNSIRYTDGEKDWESADNIDIKSEKSVENAIDGVGLIDKACM
jgi:hypothetical protein